MSSQKPVNKLGPQANTFTRNASLIALVLQQVGLILFIQFSRTSLMNSKDYLASTVVVSSEALKLVLNLFLEFFLGKGKGQEDQSSAMDQRIFTKSSLSLLVPALAYVIQNNLLFVALANLSVPVYQVTNQGKLVTTAILSRLLLGKRLSWMQYLSLLFLALGVALVQLLGMKESKSQQESAKGQNKLLGLAAVILSCFTSGFAGVYFERMLKATTDVSVYMRNIQLAMWSIILGLVPVLWDLQAIRNDGFLQGYNAIIWTIISCQAVTGLLVALVMKYADTILKGFATSVAGVVATVLSIFIWDTWIDHFFVFGVALVMSSVKLYSKYPYQQELAHQSARQSCAPQITKSLAATRTGLLLLLILPVFNMISQSLQLTSSYGLGPSAAMKQDRPELSFHQGNGQKQIRNETTVKQGGKKAIAKPPAIMPSLTFSGGQALQFFGKCPNPGEKIRPNVTVTYLQSAATMAGSKTRTDCGKTLTVMSWLMDRLNSYNETMLVAYGELIHLLREGDLVHPDGKYIDDDFDTWVTPSTFQIIVNLAPEMWDKFGWTIRIFKNCQNTVLFGQYLSACGHQFDPNPFKALQPQPAIELYILNSLNTTVIQDAWQGTYLAPNFLFPQQRFKFHSKGSNVTIDLQIPRESERILNCLYGNWSVFSTEHAGVEKKCL